MEEKTNLELLALHLRVSRYTTKELDKENLRAARDENT